MQKRSHVCENPALRMRRPRVAKWIRRWGFQDGRPVDQVDSIAGATTRVFGRDTFCDTVIIDEDINNNAAAVGAVVV